jgi:hypothetical protein
MKMVRKQVYITPEQNSLLKGAAKRLGLTEAEVVRRAVELTGRDTVLEELEYLKSFSEVLGRLRDSPPPGTRFTDDLPWGRADLYVGHRRSLDDEAWEEELAFIEERARSAPGERTPMKWRREDSYDRRRSRLPG